MVGKDRTVRMLLVGAGLIGRRHADAIARADGAALAAVVDPAPAGREVAERYGAPCFASLDEALGRDGAGAGSDAAILATPSALHVDGALATLAAGLPTLVEKPIATTLRDARRGPPRRNRSVQATEDASYSV